MKRFDRKFGVDFVRALPALPAVYLFRDAAGEVLYTGKAKNIRRRLATYRSPSRRKAHHKLRALVREAHTLEVRLQPSEAEALLVESQLIRELRPRFNVDGAFDFLYPAIGTGEHEGRLILCLTSEPERFEHLGLQWHGSFRPRRRARDAFDALVELFGYVGHVEPRSRLPEAPRTRGARLVAFRRVPPAFLASARRLLDGEDEALLGELSLAMLESSAARRAASEVAQALRLVKGFYRHDIRRLRAARIAAERIDCFVPRSERDALFLQFRLAVGRSRELRPASPSR
jgi:excinuclease UvrABC nuclease subunit